MEKVSIIVPVYKVEKYLNYCIESIVNQTYSNLEIILVDDGSPDLCPKICDEWSQKDSRIKVIHKENGGLSSARNIGIENATAKFISFVDSDDTIHPNMVEILMKGIMDTDSNISMCSWKKVSQIQNPKNKKVNLNNLNFKVFENDNVFELLYNKKVPLIMAAWAKIYSKDFFDDVLYPVGKIHEDEEVIHQILCKCKRLSFVDLKMYNNTQRNDSITASTFNKRRLYILDILKRRIDFIKKNKPNFEEQATHHYLKILILYYFYAKWGGIEIEILEKIKKEIDVYYKLGYRNKVVTMFYKCPKLLSLALKVRERLV